MRYYPVFLDIAGKPCVVVGGGEVAERKVRGLLASGAKVTVVSPELTPGLEALEREGSIVRVAREYREGDVGGAMLVVCASASGEANAAASGEAASEGSLVNVVDDPERCSFIAPSVVDRDPVLIAVSTSGSAPAIAKEMRKRLEKDYGPEYSTFAKIVGTARTYLLKTGAGRDKKERVINALADSELPALIRRGESVEIDRLLENQLGPGVNLKALGFGTGTGKGATTEDK